MSWTFTAQGSPEKVAEALEARSQQLSDDNDRQRFEDAKPYLLSLVKRNAGASENPVGLRLSASGSGSGTGQAGEAIRSDISVVVERLVNFVG